MDISEKAQSHWYVLQIMSGREKGVFDLLQASRERDALEGIDDGIDDVKLPVEKVEVTTTKRGVKKVITREKKSYPGYLLIQARLYEDNGRIRAEVWDLIKNTKGVIAFVGGAHPEVLSPADVAEMIHSEEDVEVAKPKVLFSVGEKVMVKSGAFAGLPAVIEGIDKARARLNLSVSMFGRLTPVNLSNDEVEKVTEE